MNQYQLRTDVIGRKRLDLQGKVYNPGSQQFVLSQGIKKGYSVLEIGCGSGVMTKWLADQVGPQGRVLCIDNSRSQVLATQRRIKKFKLKQVECRELSVFDLDQLKEKFDLIYLRFVLIHLDDPFTALSKIKNRMKKGGRLISNEMINSCSFSYPFSPVFDQRRRILEQFFIKNGRNPNFSLGLKTLLQKLKLTVITESLFQPMLITTIERKLLTLFFYEVKDKLISLNILTEDEWLTFINDLEKIELDKNHFIALSSMYQICVRK